jgi:glycosyltransferase involved in cell wall biosynthesis
VSERVPGRSGRGPRVLMTTDTVGGVLGYSVDLCGAISRAGGQVLLVTLGPRAGAALSAELSALPGVELIATDYKLEWMDDPFGDVWRSGAFLQELAQAYRPDVVHLNGFSLGALTFDAPKVVVAHSCVLSWWRAVHATDAPERYAEYRTHVTRGLRAADAVVTPTRTMLHALYTHYTDELRAVVIPNAAGPVPRAARARDGVCSAGRLWDPAKNLELVVRAARNSRWTFRLAGALAAPGGTNQPGTALRDLPPNVQLMGMLPRNRLAQLLGESAVYVHPARYEPFGLAVLEAAQAGCALVLSDIPSLRELWDGAALFVPVDDPEQLSRTLERLRTDGALRSGLALRARMYARRFGLDAFARRYLDLYADVQRHRHADRGECLEPRARADQNYA